MGNQTVAKQIWVDASVVTPAPAPVSTKQKTQQTPQELLEQQNQQELQEDKKETGQSCCQEAREGRVEEKIIKKAARGNRAALKSLCEAIARQVTFRVMRKFSNQTNADQRDVEDVAQEVLIRVCEGIHKLKDARAFGGWLNTIINNETNRYLSKQKKHGVTISMDEYLEDVIAEEEEQDEDYLPQEYVFKNEERKEIMAIVDQLPERQLEAVMLHYYEGMTITETAHAMNVTTQAVSIHLSRAQKAIRSCLDRNMQKASSDTATAKRNLSALPFGLLLTQVLSQEAASAPPLSNATIDEVVKTALSKSSETATVNAAVSSVFRPWLVGFAVLTVTVFLVASVLWVQNTMPTAEQYTQLGALAVVSDGEVVFDGGDTPESTVNPTHAEAWATNERGDLVVQSWQITVKNSSKVLASGMGTEVDYALREMKESAKDGSYVLGYILEDTAGATYTLSREFTIQTEP